MRTILTILLFTIVYNYSIAQTTGQPINHADSIAYLSEDLTGKWKQVNDSVNTNRVIEFDLVSAGKGSYTHYSNYDFTSDIQVLETCQPIPVLKIVDGKFYINFIGMAGENTIEFILDDDVLILEPNKEHSEKYERLR